MPDFIEQKFKIYEEELFSSTAASGCGLSDCLLGLYCGQNPAKHDSDQQSHLFTWKDYKAVTADLKQVYQSASEEEALLALDRFSENRFIIEFEDRLTDYI